MARRPRIEYPGAIYHVTARGNRRERIVHDEIDRYSLIKTLGCTSRKDAGISTVASRRQKYMTAFLPGWKTGNSHAMTFSGERPLLGDMGTG